MCSRVNNFLLATGTDCRLREPTWLLFLRKPLKQNFTHTFVKHPCRPLLQARSQPDSPHLFFSSYAIGFTAWLLIAEDPELIQARRIWWRVRCVKLDCIESTGAGGGSWARNCLGNEWSVLASKGTFATSGLLPHEWLQSQLRWGTTNTKQTGATCCIHRTCDMFLPGLTVIANLS